MKTHKGSKEIILFLMAVSFILSSCNKNTPIWEARVLEYGSNKPVANATVYLVEKSGEVILGPVGSTIVDSTSTGPDGKFRFKLLHESAAHYIRGKADLYYDAEIYRGGNTSNDTKKDLILDPHAWIRIHVKNVNPVDQYDGIRFESYSCDSEGFKGFNIDTFNICSNKGNKSHDLYYNVAKIGSGNQRFKLTYTLGAHDTTNILLEY